MPAKIWRWNASHPAICSLQFEEMKSWTHWLRAPLQAVESSHISIKPSSTNRQRRTEKKETGLTDKPSCRLLLLLSSPLEACSRPWYKKKRNVLEKKKAKLHSNARNRFHNTQVMRTVLVGGRRRLHTTPQQLLQHFLPFSCETDNHGSELRPVSPLEAWMTWYKKQCARGKMHTLKCKKPLSQHTAAMNLVGRRRRRLHTTPQQLLYFVSLSLWKLQITELLLQLVLR